MALFVPVVRSWPELIMMAIFLLGLRGWGIRQLNMSFIDVNGVG